ncbi:hypothetical protein [Ruminococcus sp. NK3A76]|uniref:hypothetical protein n=1 Tax=Ruminococcus sp. NK3A76 TaxID=877411 RepID=UPI00048CA276|nr:hypothetical protein [Ruminococcus sp. NK3A76]
MINERFELPVKAGLIILWAAAVVGMYYLSEGVSEPLVARFYGFMIADPLLLMAGSFMAAKIFGSRWVYKAAIIVVSAVLYFASPLGGVVPNLMIVTAISVIFGSGIGAVFSDRSGSDDEKAAKEHYTPILGDENTPAKKNRKKKAKRK